MSNVIKTEAPRRRPGGRSERIQAVVLESAFDLLIERGFDGFSINDIATRAGVHETSLYRRWKTREALVLQASLWFAETALPLPETGALKSDLADFLSRIISLLISPSGAALLLLMTAQAPDLIKAREAFWRERLSSARRILEKARERGDQIPDVDSDLFFETLFAPIYFRALISRSSMIALCVDSMIDRHLRAFEF